jgi:citrate lyase beta subunit
MKTSLSTTLVGELLSELGQGNATFAAAFPGEPLGRQPVHTVYGGANLFTGETITKLGGLARRALEQYAPDATALSEALGVAFDAALYAKVVAKLEREPIEDFRIDFEDGYGARGDDEEDGHAVAAGRALATGARSPFIGLRIKPLTDELKARALRTLDLFVTAFAEAGGELPMLLVTLPKVQHAGQLEALVRALEVLEERTALPARSLQLEFMVELTQTLVGADGALLLPRLVRAAKGRCFAAHFGTYDYTASCGVTANEQRMTHPAADFARHVMQVCLARTGVFLSDGATTVMPIGPHRGGALTAAQQVENRAAVHAAWRRSHLDVRDSLMRGFWQGWDLHPAQVPIRYATLFHFFEHARASSATRLKQFVARAAQATLVGEQFDDAATGQGLLNFFLRGLSCGAFTEAEVVAETGLTLEQLQTRNFAALTR